MSEQTSETSTGDPRVDAVVDRLETMDGLDLAERAAAYAEMQADLAAVLDGEENDPRSGD